MTTAPRLRRVATPATAHAYAVLAPQGPVVRLHRPAGHVLDLPVTGPRHAAPTLDDAELAALGHQLDAAYELGRLGLTGGIR